MSRTILFATALSLVALAACGPDAPEPATEVAEVERRSDEAGGTTAVADVELSAKPTSVAASAGAPIGDDGQNFVFDANGPLQIVGSDTQYEIHLPTDLLFDFDRAELRPDSAPLLEKVREHFRAHQADQLHVRGHTDSKGSDQYNFTLSLDRATAVCGWLKRERVAQFTNCIGRGEQEPIAPNETAAGADNPEGRQRNRRVTLYVVDYPDAGAMLADAERQADDARAKLPPPD